MIPGTPLVSRTIALARCSSLVLTTAALPTGAAAIGVIGQSERSEHGWPAGMSEIAGGKGGSDSAGRSVVGVRRKRGRQSFLWLSGV